MMPFSQETADAICSKVADGMSLRKACEEVGEFGASVGSFLRWCDERPELAEQYARARATGTDAEFEELEELQSQEPERDDKGRIDPGFVAWKRLQVDTKKWALSKKAPKKYGEKLELAGDAANPLRHIHTVENVIVDTRDSVPAQK